MKRWVISLFFAAPMWANAQSVEEIRQAMDAYDYEKPIELIAPEKGDTLFTPLRAKALKAMNRHQEALNEWNSLLSADSTNAKVLAELGECYRSMNRSNQAALCYGKALNLQPRNKFFRQQHTVMN